VRGGEEEEEEGRKSGDIRGVLIKRERRVARDARGFCRVPAISLPPPPLSLDPMKRQELPVCDNAARSFIQFVQLQLHMERPNVAYCVPVSGGQPVINRRSIIAARLNQHRDS